MTRPESQLQIIEDKLYQDGFVDRRWCIDNKISERLSARIDDLEKRGWRFRTQKDGSRNFTYRVVSYPDQKPLTNREINEQRVRNLASFDADTPKMVKKVIYDGVRAYETFVPAAV